MKRYAAIFKDGSISLPHTSEANLEKFNAHRWASLHKVLVSDDVAAENKAIRDTLHAMKLPYACACQSCFEKTLGIN